jgi:hypothetical protein
VIQLIFSYIVWIGTFTPLVCASFGIFLWWQKKTDTIKIILVLFCLNSFIFSICQVILANYKISNMAVGNVYMLLEIILLVTLYTISFQRTLQKVISLLFGVVCLTVCLCDFIFYQGLHDYHAFPRSFESIGIDFLALSYFYLLTIEQENKNTHYIPMFWANTGILIYFGSNVFLFATIEQLGNYSKDLNFIVWSMHAIFLIMMFVFMGVAMWTFPPKIETQKMTF